MKEHKHVSNAAKEFRMACKTASVQAGIGLRSRRDLIGHKSYLSYMHLGIISENGSHTREVLFLVLAHTHPHSKTKTTLKHFDSSSSSMQTA